MNIDFDYWMKLQQTNPKQFERERVELMRTYIDSLDIPDERRWKYHKLQTDINKERRKHSDPITATVSIISAATMMHSTSLPLWTELTEIFTNAGVQDK